MTYFRAFAFVIFGLGAVDSSQAQDGDRPPNHPASALDLTAYDAGAELTDLGSAATTERSSPVELCCDCPLWSVQAGAIILSRTSRSVVLLEDTLSGDAILNANDFSDPWGAGPDLSVRRWLASGNSLAVRFFAVDSLNSRTSLTTPVI